MFTSFICQSAFVAHRKDTDLEIILGHVYFTFLDKKINWISRISMSGVHSIRNMARK